MPEVYDKPAASESTATDPISYILELVKKAGISIEDALDHPMVGMVMRQMGVTMEQIRKREAERKASMMKWGAAALVVGYLLWRTRK
jgi:hypothetical protein